MKKALIIILAALFILGMTAVAYAADPVENTPHTFIETDPGRTANPPDVGAVPSDTLQPPLSALGSLSGASAWAYKDAADSATKFEGSYEAFQDTANNLYDFDNTGRDRGPHGGYTTTTQKCKVCHAVHRANGAYVLLRVDDADNACSYCHVGDHRHSVVSAYWGADTIYPSNGHTIGAGKDIPDSSVWQWSDEKIFEGLNNQTGEVETSSAITVRRYLKDRVKLMRNTAGNKVGPTFLRCMSCHQVHNASQLIWKPYDSAGTIMSQGYKLLRKNPSGLNQVATADATKTSDIVSSTDALTLARINNTSYHPPGHGNKTPLLAAVDSDYTGENVVAGKLPDPGGLGGGMGSPNSTGYTTYYNDEITDPAFRPGSDYGRVEEVTMSVWCANCHNLNIAGKEEIESNWGGGGDGETMLTDRSHVVPMAYTTRGGAAGSMGSQCYSCHNNDMPRVASNGTYTVQGVSVDFTSSNVRGCGPCHISPGVYRAYKQTYRSYLGVAGGNSLSDFPHSGSSAGFKLLNDVPVLGTLSSSYDPAFFTPFRPGSGDGLDKICGICHLTKSGSHAVGVSK